MTQELALHWLATVGPLALIALMILNRIGVPTWASIVLVAAGSFARRGMLNGVTSMFCAFVGLLAGDLLAYSLGRQGVQRLLVRFEQRQVILHACRAMARRSGLAIFLSRFLFLFLAVPINLLASTMHVSRGRFLLVAAAGNLLFVLVYFGAGYFFSGNWPALWQTLSRQPPVVFLVIGLIGLGVALWAWFMLRRRPISSESDHEANPSD